MRPSLSCRAVQPLVGQQPCAVVLDHAADRAEPRAVRLAHLADAGLDAVSAGRARGSPRCRRPRRRRACRSRADDLGQAQQCGKSRVSWTLAAEGTTPSGMPSVETTIWYLVPALPRSVGLGPVSSPPRLARTEQLSTTTSQGAASGPERTIRIRATWTRRSKAVALQPSRRRRRVEPQARPAAARSSRHCTPSRTKKRSVSTTSMVGRVAARSRTVGPRSGR